MPLSELESSGAKVVARVRASGQPVVFTEDGKPAVVLLPAEQFDELADRGAFVDAVQEGLDDVEAGRTMSTSELRARLEKRFGPLT
jgi:prevent-host-death family protein